MRDALQQLRLLQLASSSQPVGSFTWSQGLEWVVETGWVNSVDTFAHWQTRQMENSVFTVDLPLFARLYHAGEQDDAGRRICWPVGKPVSYGKKSAAGARRSPDWSSTGSQNARSHGARYLPTVNSAVWPGWACSGAFRCPTWP